MTMNRSLPRTMRMPSAFATVGVLALSLGALRAELTFELLPAGEGLTTIGEVGSISTDGSRIGGAALRLDTFSEEAIVWDAVVGMQSVHPALDHPARSIAYGVSDSGDVVAGWSLSTGDGVFCWIGEVDHTFNNWTGAAAFAVSRDGAYAVGKNPVSRYSTDQQAVRWPTAGGAPTILGDLPGGAVDAQATAISADGLVVAGWGTTSVGREAFRWQGDTLEGLGDLPGGRFFSEASAVSGDGAVVVGRSVSSNGIEAFRWTEEDGIRGLGDLPGGFAFSEAFGVSDDGEIIVGLSHSGRGHELFLHDAEGGMRSLPALLRDSGVDLSGWKFDKCHARLSGDGNVLAGNAVTDEMDRVLWRISGLQSVIGDTPVSPIAIACAPGGTEISVTIQTEAGFAYRIESANELGSAATWKPASAEILGDGAPYALTMALAAGETQRFYRLSVWTGSP